MICHHRCKWSTGNWWEIGDGKNVQRVAGLGFVLFNVLLVSPLLGQNVKPKALIQSLNPQQLWQSEGYWKNWEMQTKLFLGQNIFRESGLRRYRQNECFNYLNESFLWCHSCLSLSVWRSASFHESPTKAKARGANAIMLQRRKKFKLLIFLPHNL